MSLHVHHLTGCAPSPLAHYLKALGILRLVAEQKDAEARLWWQDEHAVLATALTEEELIHFFAEEYRPSPLIAPWNGGSGFYASDNQKPLEAIQNSENARLAEYREAIKTGIDVIGGIPTKPEKDEKPRMMIELNRRARPPLLAWLHAAFVLGDDGSPEYPSLLGTGGNDGRLDFTLNFMSHIGSLFDYPTMSPLPHCISTLRAALFCVVLARVQTRGAVGQFLPGNAGGANATTGYAGDACVNSWDFLLMLEGSLVFASAVSKRFLTHRSPLASAPFAVYLEVGGYGTAANGEGAPRGEQWLPLWLAPASWPDVRGLFAEGRMHLRNTVAARATEAARAVSRLGVARGLSEFERVAFLERNGQANLAIPLKRWAVHRQPYVSLTDHAAIWIQGLQRAARDEHAPQSWRAALHRCTESLLACCQESINPRRHEELLCSLGAAEQTVSGNLKQCAERNLRPLSILPSEWLSALLNTPEIRLAAALAAQVGTKDDEDGSADSSQPVRIHFLPLEWDSAKKRWKRHAFADRLGPEAVARSGNFVRDANAVVRRRMMAGRFNLRSGYGMYARLADIAAFVRGDLDDTLILELARPLMVLDWRNAPQLPPPRMHKDDWGALGLYGILRLAHMPSPFAVGGASYRPKTDPAILQRLVSGDAPGAFALAARRLSSAGLRPFQRTAIANRALAERLAAALVFPIHPETAGDMARRLCRCPFPDAEDETATKNAATTQGVQK